MIAVGHAHQRELLAARARDRAALRVTATGLVGISSAKLSRLGWHECARRALKARVALHEAIDELRAATSRHTRWYREHVRLTSRRIHTTHTTNTNTKEATS